MELGEDAMTDIADRQALQDVMLRYAAGVDERDFDLYRSCFADDVEIVGFAGETISGADTWLEYVRSALEQYGATQHMLGPQLAVIDGDTAETRNDVQALHQLKSPEGGLFTLWATYKTRMQMTNGEWKIVRHELAARATEHHGQA